MSGDIWHPKLEYKRYDYNLNESSIVVDIGGYKGLFSEKIYQKYACNIHIFEPVKEYYNELVNKFSNLPKIKIYNLGLSDINKTEHITITGESSSVFINSQEGVEITLVDIDSIFNDFSHIDLLKINVEGSEYEILDKIIKKQRLPQISNLQIQFHKWIKNATLLRQEIRSELAKTHKLTFDYEFVWENWQLI